MSTAAIAEQRTIKAGTATRTRWLAMAGGITVLVIGFLLWPYQHWLSEERQSVLVGWMSILSYSSNADWQFCYAVPVITGFLVYRQRESLQALPLKGSWLGAAILVPAMICYWLGYRVDTGYMGFAAIQLTIAGLILLLGGVAWMRILFLPWVFLFFAWPMFPLDNLLAARLKIPTAWSADKLLSLVGIDVVREGSALQSAADFATGIPQGSKFTLDVAESCSGMRSLYSLIMVSVLYSFVGLKRTLPRLVLIASAIPLAVAGNVVRLLLLAVGCLLFGQEFAIGKKIGDQQSDSFYHLLMGFIVFGVALSGMFMLATWLEGRHWKKLNLVKAVKATGKGSGVADDAFMPVLIKSATALVLMTGGILLCWSAPVDAKLSQPGILPLLPEVIGEYAGTEEEMSYRERVVFDPGVTLKRRNYTTPSGKKILGTLVMSGESKKALHTPELCLPDQGWTISSHETVPIRLKDNRQITASIMRLHRDVEVAPGHRVRVRGLNLYWYIGSKGVSTPSYKMSHYYTYRDAILFNFNHHWSQAAFFMPMPEVDAGQTFNIDEVIAMQELAEFASVAASEFMIAPQD